MAAKPSSKSPAAKPARKATRRKAKPAAKPAPKPAADVAGMFRMPDAAQMAKYAKTLTPEQAFEMYRANAQLALEVIENAIESTARVRKLQFEGEEKARSMQRKAARGAAAAGDVPSLMAVGQSAAQEAVEHSMRYWGEMFALIVEIQKRLFSLMEKQTAGMPGAKEAQAALAMLPDLTKMQNVVDAMQGVVASGGTAFEQAQRLMGDLARMTGMRR
jgi:hypothetical protein